MCVLQRKDALIYLTLFFSFEINKALGIYLFISDGILVACEGKHNKIICKKPS